MTQRRVIPVLLILTGLGALSAAYIAQFGFGLEPCILCLYQRVPYALVALLGVIGWMRPQGLKGILFLAALTFAVGGAIAFYHVGVEQHWWASVTGCTGKVGQTFSTADLMASMQTKPPKPCDAVDWTLLGVSMAGWNVVFSVCAAGACLFARRRLEDLI